MNKENQNRINIWGDLKLNVVIPMAGLGSRFVDSEHTMPKPLIKVNQKPMIQVAVENLNIEANYIYVVQKQHRLKYKLDNLLNLITPNCTIVEVDGLTAGAASTALLAKQFINSNNPLFFANSDQFVEWESKVFMQKMKDTNADGGIVTFKSTKPHFAYLKHYENGLVQKVVKNEPISEIAAVGYYYWRLGSDFVKYAEQMITKNIRVNNEFYIDSVYNEAIENGEQIRSYNSDRFWSLGTPKELDYFLEFYKK